MNKISAKLKSNWVLFFAIIYTIFLVENLIYIINYDVYMKSLIGKSKAYKFVTISALFLKPIFDLSFLYIIFFKDTLLTPKSDKFSILAEHGDLSKYNYEQINIILAKWKRKLVDGNGFFDSEWENNSIRIIIRFDNADGKFIQIIEEEWKHYNMIFKREIILNNISFQSGI